MKTIEFQYDIGDNIKIKAIEIEGRIDAMLFDSGGCQYRVIYWYDGKRNQLWLYEWETEKDTKKK